MAFDQLSEPEKGPGEQLGGARKSETPVSSTAGLLRITSQTPRFETDVPICNFGGGQVSILEVVSAWGPLLRLDLNVLTRSVGRYHLPPNRLNLN